MTVRFLADEDLRGSIIRGLRSREPSIDVLDVKSSSLRGTKDPALLEIAAEQGREPGNPGRDIALIGPRAVVDEEAEIGQRAVQGQVEELVIGLDRGRAPAPCMVGGDPVVGADPGRVREKGGGAGRSGGLRLGRDEGPFARLGETEIGAAVIVIEAEALFVVS